MKFTDKKFEEYWHVYATGKHKWTEIVICHQARHFEPIERSFDIQQAKQFVELLNKAIVDAEARLLMTDDD